MKTEFYLGDGVYATYDGYMWWLDLRGQSFPGEHVCRIALDPTTLASFDAVRDHVKNTAMEETT